jgi:hypothetical protein
MLLIDEEGWLDEPLVKKEPCPAEEHHFGFVAPRAGLHEEVMRNDLNQVTFAALDCFPPPLLPCNGIDPKCDGDSHRNNQEKQGQHSHLEPQRTLSKRPQRPVLERVSR